MCTGFRVRPIRCSGLRSEEHTSELQSQSNLVCRLLLEKKNKEFEISNYDAFFTNVMGLSLDAQNTAVRQAKDEAGTYNRELDVYRVAAITCRRTSQTYV